MKLTQEKQESVMNETFLNYYKKLLNGESMHSKSIPKMILDSSDFQNMLRANIILKQPSGKGYNYQLNELKKEVFSVFYNKTFPNPEILNLSRASNIAKFKNSKASKVQNIPIVFLKGHKMVWINNQQVDLDYYTNNFGLLGIQLNSLQTEKICFVENKETFLSIEKLFPQDFLFIHVYGRVGKKLLENLKISQILVFSDFDYVGLNEYLKFKEYFSFAEFYLPANFDFLFSTYSTELTKKGKRGQKPNNRVLNSTDENVVKIRELIQKSNKFLEQEILLYEC